jgi:ribonuclease G
MTKEMVISSTRHETKVAILEDDQLVEVYFQRANEYSLAGSIHKGRVTRVLPGMQSAFVDLGLERDTFLYVSDFFEENADDIERVPDERPSRTERAERVERSERQERQERPAPVHAVEHTPTPADQEAVDQALQMPAAPPPVERSEEHDDSRDRRGRRSRRRRNRGRGFPDSKYAAAQDEPAEPVREPSEQESDPGIVVLPGESLAKYRAATGGEREEALEEAEETGETDAEFELTSGSDDLKKAVEAVIAAREAAVEEMEAPGETEEEPLPADFATIANDYPEELPPANAIPDAPKHDGEKDSTEPAETEPDGPETMEEGEAPAVDESELGGGLESESAEGEDELIGERAEEDDEDREIQALILEGDAGYVEEVAPVEAAEAPLTAHVREQGSRYMHRVSRRMRRRMKSGVAEAPQPAPPPAPKPEHRPSTRPEKPATQSITELLKEGQEILVQIAKEPLGQKGARITSHIALPGRYVVYMPTLDHMGVSRKIASDDERQRLKKILQKHRVGVPGGYIIRTAGEGKSEDEIATDMAFLANLWMDMRQKAEKKPAPALLHHDLDIVQRVLRDQFNDTFKSVWVDSEEVYESILRFLQRFQPALVPRVKLYTRTAPVFDAFGITNELEKALRPKVWLKSGGYIVINQTEALVAIDVNTGKFVGKSNRLEDTIVKTNTEAIREIVRQLRLRDLGGIIVIDFIDMDERKNRQKVMQALEDAMRNDRAPYKILQFNDFGLVAITRKRVKQSLERTLCTPCPYCEGAGYVKSVQTIIGEILQEAHKVARAVEGSDVVLRVHPDVAKVFKSNQNHYLEEIEEILRRPVLVTSDAALHHEKFDLA